MLATQAPATRAPATRRPAILARPAAARTPGALSRLLGACRHGIAGYFARRDAIAWLREVDSSALEDIGLTRSEIEDAVRGRIIPPDRARGR
ncbi:hypothetical protein BIWAKO_06354 [Bosea sp. BIWAKO-01]|nr:hypothetical protein BIWAKO_06354 [Bosea sp. BIWAKO-01]